VTSLRHSIELLQEDDDVARERRVSFYDVMSRSTERLHRLVESLLDFARMEDGRKPYNLQPVNPVALVMGIVRDFQKDSASCGCRVAVAISPGTPGEIHADTAAVGHALWNLLDNAVKYSPDGGAISVSALPHPRGLAIAVADEGIGIPREERGDIFLKFVRGEQASRLGIKGTGVGLAIVCHIMRAHGGSVELDSEPGKGSTFRLILPVAS
jgi:two-component system phosphate regulon sensor histidine kinase PhoR